MRALALGTLLGNHSLSYAVSHFDQMTTVNQATGTVDGKEPLQSLTAIHSGSKAGFTNKRTFANVPLFGWNAICGPDMLGRIVHSGSSVEVTERRQSLSDFT